MEFDKLLEKAADWLKETDDLTIISHSDADGLCATAIIEALCQDTEKKFSTTFLLQISSLALERLAKDANKNVILVDMGSSHLDAIAKNFKGKEVLVVDHHRLQGEAKDALVINPLLADLDGTRDICSSTIAFEIVDRIVNAADLAPVAIIGAQADNQEPFQGYNKKALDLAIEDGRIETREGARLFGIHSKPLPQLVAFSYDLKIPGITKDMQAAENFLRELGIDTRRTRYFGQLTKDQQDKLDAALIEASPIEESRITHYTITGAPRGPLMDTRESATLLNACGRVGKPELAVKLLLGEHLMREVREAQKEYRMAIKRAHSWFGGSDRVIRQGSLVLIDARADLPPFVAGTLCSVLVRGKEVPEDTVVVCLARMADGTGTTKVSGRTAGTFNIAEMMDKLATKFKGEGGGHSNAAGALIPEEVEQKFIDEVKKLFK